MGQYSAPTTYCTSGVPQGFILGPLLFAAYASPIADVISSHGMLFHQYTDDTQLYVAAKGTVDIADALKTVSSCTNAVQSWFLLNDLLLNPNKSEVIVIDTQTQVKAYSCGDHVDVAGTLKLRDNVKSLGVTFDRELSFDKHVNLVCRACNYHLWSLRNIRKYLTVDMANTIACSVVGSRLDYCNFVFYKTTKANIIATCTEQSCSCSGKCQAAHMPTICLRSYTGCQSVTISSTRLLSSRTKC